jgi:hypothetical protein
MKENPEKRELWQRQIEAWKSSGLSRRVYCEQNEIKLSTLDYWCQKLSSSRKEGEIGKGSWIPLRIDEDEPSSRIDLQIGRITVAVKPGFDPALLTALLRTIGALC